MSEIRKFIEDNDISFYKGCRNSSVTVLIGYSQHLGMEEVDLRKELFDEIEEDGFILTEIKRLWSYCKAKNYKDFWMHPEAIKQYKINEEFFIKK